MGFFLNYISFVAVFLSATTLAKEPEMLGVDARQGLLPSPWAHQFGPDPSSECKKEGEPCGFAWHWTHFGNCCEGLTCYKDRGPSGHGMFIMAGGYATCSNQG